MSDNHEPWAFAVANDPRTEEQMRADYNRLIREAKMPSPRAWVGECGFCAAGLAPHDDGRHRANGHEIECTRVGKIPHAVRLDGSYYAEAGMVWKAPVKTARPEGGCSISIGFPVCKMHEAVGPEGAKLIAELMNRGDRLPELVRVLEALRDDRSVPVWIKTLVESVIPSPVGGSSNG